MSFTVQRATLAAGAPLIAALNDELSAMYPEEEARHFTLDEDEVAPGRGAFVIARDVVADLDVACGAVRLVDDPPGAAELKRMYVVPAARGRGVGRLLVEALEREADRLGATRIVLETGVRNLDALALYTRCGFTRILPYGEYVGSPLSVCLAKLRTP